MGISRRENRVETRGGGGIGGEREEKGRKDKSDKKDPYQKK